MRDKLESSILLALFSWLGMLLIFYLSPRLDIVSIFATLGLALIIGLFFYLYMKREENRTSAAIEELTELLQSIECGKERIVMEDDRFGVLRDEIYKSLVAKRQKQEEAVLARQQLKRNMEDVTHQIKTPLTGVLLLLEFMETDQENSHEYLKRIQREVKKLNELSDLLLKLSSLDAGAVNFQKEPFSIQGLLLDVELDLDYMLEKKGIAVTISGDDFTLLGDRIWLMQALINLTKNAIEAVNKQGKIEYVLTHNAIYRSVTVKDNGPGLTKEQMRKIFERFYKANPQTQGFGIGLAMVKSIVEQHGGEVLVDSNKDGSAFELRFYSQETIWHEKEASR